MLLDLMLRGLSGTEVCRPSVSAPASRSSSSPLATARSTKSWGSNSVPRLRDQAVPSRELVARIRAVLRRGVDADDLVGSTVEAGPVRMDVERHTVSVDGRAVSLPLKEFDLLELLLRNAGRVLTRGQLIDRVWGADYVGDTKTLDVHVKRLGARSNRIRRTPSIW